MKRNSAALTVLLATLLFVAVSGCSKSKDGKTATQVAAKVNREEISVHQIDNMLARAGVVAPDQAKAAGKQILERLIDQELLVQQAHDRKLDREPRVMQAIEASKRELLARAYLDQVAAAAAKPADQEVNDYFEKHPELFKARRVYNLREIAISAPGDFMPKLQEQMNKGTSLSDLLEWLKGQKIHFASNAGVKAAEQLPLDLLPEFHKLKDGQTAVIPSPNAILVVQVVSSENQPLELKQATPFIEQFLINQKRSELASAEVKKLRTAAKIEYVGDFAKTEEAVEPAKEAGKPAAAAATAPAPAAPAGEAAAEKQHIDKGVAAPK
jgi:EpsD family peptidyl-prolyl cis-trans isomerase